jgi:enhancing lycopene biosynthesis protein 2
MRIGVLLAGCGLYDGSDVHETVLVLEALEAAGERPLIVAPDVPQTRTIDHLTGDVIDGESRGVLRESARLARGAVHALAEVREADLEALIVPGGYGPAINLGSGFAVPGTVRTVRPEVASFLRHFVETGKPLGLIGLGELPVRRLLGQSADPPPTPSDPRALRVDPDRPILHTPGFAGFARIADVRAGIGALVEAILARLESAPRTGEGA